MRSLGYADRLPGGQNFPNGWGGRFLANPLAGTGPDTAGPQLRIAGPDRMDLSWDGLVETAYVQLQIVEELDERGEVIRKVYL